MGRVKPKTKRRAPATNEGSNSQASGQSDDQTTMTRGIIPQGQIEAKEGKLASKIPRNVVIQMVAEDCDEYENWAATHPESSLGPE